MGPKATSGLEVFAGNQRIDLFAGAGGEDRVAEVAVLEEPADAGQRLEVQPRRVLGSDQGEEEEGALAVDGVEVDSGAADAEAGRQSGQSGELAVGNCHTLADARAAQP